MASFPFYMVNRILSMDVSYLPIINNISIATDLYMDNESKYRVLQHLLPKKVGYTKYIKAKTKNDSVKGKVVSWIKKYYKCSDSVALDYYNIIVNSKDMEYELYNIMAYSNVDHKEINKVIKEFKK
jgi:hypothetical protein